MLSENSYFPVVTESEIGFVLIFGKFYGVGIKIPIKKIITDQRTGQVLFDFIVWQNSYGVSKSDIESDEFKLVVSDIINDMMSEISREASDNEIMSAVTSASILDQTTEQADQLLTDVFDQIKGSSEQFKYNVST